MDLQKVLGKVFDTAPIKYLLREGETNVDRICIPLAKTYDGLDISSYVFELRAESEKDTIARQVLTKVVGEDEVRLTWVVSSAFTAVFGWLEPVIVGLNSEGTEVIKITGDKIAVKQTQKSRIAATPNVIADALNEITLLTNRAIAAANLAEAASAKATADAAAAAASKTSATKSATTATGAATAAAADAKRAKEEADKAEAIAGFDVTDYYTKAEVSTQFEEKADVNSPALTGNATLNGSQIATLTTETNWVAVTPLNGWTLHGSDGVRYRLTKSGRVEIDGLILAPADASTSKPAFQMPAGLRPPKQRWVSSVSDTGKAKLFRCAPAGDVFLWAGVIPAQSEVMNITLNYDL